VIKYIYEGSQNRSQVGWNGHVLFHLFQHLGLLSEEVTVDRHRLGRRSQSRNHPVQLFSLGVSDYVGLGVGLHHDLHGFLDLGQSSQEVFN
jgi:hypothetical protein